MFAAQSWSQTPQTYVIENLFGPFHWEHLIAGDITDTTGHTFINDGF